LKFIKDINLIKNAENANEHVCTEIAEPDIHQELINKIETNTQLGKVVYNNKIQSNKVIRNESSF